MVEKTGFVCSFCLMTECDKCVDIIRISSGYKLICTCKLVAHAGEPRDQQILDPATGTVFAPGLGVTKDGTVVFNE